MTNQQRTEHADQVKEQLENQGYTARVYTLDGAREKLVAFVTRWSAIFLFLALLFWQFGIFYTTPTDIESSLPDFFAIFMLGIFSVYIHEFLHGLTWWFWCKNGKKSIDAGDKKNEKNPFFYCLEPIGFKGFILGELMPFLVLGLGVCIAAAIRSSLPLLMAGVYNMAAAGDDLTIAFILLRQKPGLVLHHPTEYGFLAFNKDKT